MGGFGSWWDRNIDSIDKDVTEFWHDDVLNKDAKDAATQAFNDRLSKVSEDATASSKKLIIVLVAVAVIFLVVMLSLKK